MFHFSPNGLDFLKEFEKSLEKEKESEETIKVTLSDTPERICPPPLSMDSSKSVKPDPNKEKPPDTDLTRQSSELTEDENNRKSHFQSGKTAAVKPNAVPQKIQTGFQWKSVASATAKPVQPRFTSKHPQNIRVSSARPSQEKPFQTVPKKPVNRSQLPVTVVTVTPVNLSQPPITMVTIQPAQLVSVTSSNPLVKQTNSTQSRSTFSFKPQISARQPSSSTTTSLKGFRMVSVYISLNVTRVEFLT